jgi:hypothetical protein
VSWDAVKRVLELGPSSGLTDREFRVLLVLADRLNKRTGQLNPAARRITRDIGLEPTRPAVRSVRRTIAGLEAQGGCSGSGRARVARRKAAATRASPTGSGVTSCHPSGVTQMTAGVTQMTQTGVTSCHPNLRT